MKQAVIHTDYIFKLLQDTFFIDEYFGDLPRCIYSQISISRTHTHDSGISKGSSSSIQRSTPSNFS